MRLLQTRNLVLIGLAIAAYGTQACSSNDQDDLVTSQKTTQASSVSIHLEDASGNDIGSCAGTLVAEKLVLTAGHCVVSASTWRVEGAGKVVTATRAVTPWKKFDSTLSHPKHADIALLVLDDAIKIARYPQIATEGLKDGAKATRMHRSASGSKEFVSSDAVIRDGAAKGFNLAYTAELPKGEWLDTGGGLFDARGKVYGVVSAQGKKSSLLYITRVEGFNQWVTDSVDECGDSASGLSVRTSNDGWGGSSSGGWGGSSSGGWGGGGWGGYGGDGKKIEAGAPPSSVDAGVGSDGGGGGGSGSGTGTSGGTGTGGGTGAGDGSKSGTNAPGPNENGEVGAGANSGATCPAKPPSSSSIPGGGGAGGGAGSEGSGTNNSSTNGTNPGGNTGTGTGSGTGGGSGSTGAPGAAGLDEEPCEGAEDNPTICPPDTALCSGPSCGGCAGVTSCIDGTMDYGNCACESRGGVLGNPDGLR